MNMATPRQREDGEPEMPFVDPAPEHVHADAKGMADEPQHWWVLSASIIRTQLPIGPKSATVNI